MPEPLYPFETRVVLHGLKTTELNGKLGVIRSELNSAGRYSVFIKEENKTVGLKPENLQYEPRTIDNGNYETFIATADSSVYYGILK